MATLQTSVHNDDEHRNPRLSEMEENTRCVILKVHGYGGFRHRILELGFVKGEEVKVLKKAPLMDPVEYEIMGSHVSLRRSEAANIEVISLEANAHPDNVFHGTIEEHVAHEVEERSHEITVALVGNPNCGKTSFFNHATGLHEKVGNYSGVTVKSKTGYFEHRGYTINLVDLPGTYSLTDFSPEELYVRSFLTEQQPDIVLNVVDAGNLERNLFLTTQLIDVNLPMVMSLNMYDELQRSGCQLDIEQLERMLGFSIVPTIAKSGEGITDVLERIVTLYETGEASTKHIHINYGDDVEKCIKRVRALLDVNASVADRYHSRYVAIKLIENDAQMLRQLSNVANYDAIKNEAQQCREMLERAYDDDITSVISDLKYGFIRGALKETFTHGDERKKQLSYALDVVLTNRWLGIPVLILFLWVMFQTTFGLGAFPQQWIEKGVVSLSSWLSGVMPPGMLADLIINGVISGVGGVLIFLPNILILYFFISMMEDTGYMARAAFIMDKFMHKIGLHGKSFIPYIIGFGCGVPAVMATRILENRKDRILTAITVPFMSCSARLPVYLLFVAAFFPSHQGLILLAIYLFGVLMAIVTSIIVNKLAFKSATDQFVMELPPYRMPTARNIVIHMWDKSVSYLKKMGTVIFLASVIIWALGYFPRNEQAEIGSIEQLEQSYIGKIGHGIAPIVKPLGMDWKMGVSLFTGLAAKEIVVSSLGVLYQSDSSDGTRPLDQELAAVTDEMGNPFFTPLRVISFLVFVLLYFPCIACITTIGREVGRKWAIFAVCYTTSVAWLVSFAVYQIGGLLW